MSKTHQLSRTPTYQSWLDMVKRCSNPNTAQYADYGGRGISVHASLRSFEGFLSCLGIKPDGMTIDRIDNNGNYEPGNVRWATRAEQNRNTRVTDRIAYHGRTQSLSEWAVELGTSQGALWSRLYRDKMPVDIAFTAPPNRITNRKLSDAQIAEARIHIGPARLLAERWGVGTSCITRIRAGKRWRAMK